MLPVSLSCFVVFLCNPMGDGVAYTLSAAGNGYRQNIQPAAPLFVNTFH